MRICVIGPSFPFRGGLAHHTTLLYRYLRNRHQVTFYAFKRQYPRWLFPGKTDRDQSEFPLREAGVENLLDSFNPFTWWAVYKRVKKDKPDLVIIPWWTSFWAPQFWVIATLVRRFSTAKILFICHNVLDHESHIFSRFCARAVLSNGDHFFVHSQFDGKRLKELLPLARITYAFHPIYDFFNKGVLRKADAKRRLDLRGETILFFGFIRPYKGVDDLLRAMPQILKQRNVTLLIVGEFWGNREAFDRRVQELMIGDAIKVVDRYVPNEEVGVYFSAADLVVLPYLSGTGSGIVQLAYGLEKPVVATRVGSLPEVVEDERTGLLVDPSDPGALASAVIRFFRENREAEFVENIRRRRENFSWEHLTELIDSSIAETKAVGQEKPGSTPVLSTQDTETFR